MRLDINSRYFRVRFSHYHNSWSDRWAHDDGSGKFNRKADYKHITSTSHGKRYYNTIYIQNVFVISTFLIELQHKQIEHNQHPLFFSGTIIFPENIDSILSSTNVYFIRSVDIINLTIRIFMIIWFVRWNLANLKLSQRRNRRGKWTANRTLYLELRFKKSHGLMSFFFALLFLLAWSVLQQSVCFG